MTIDQQTVKGTEMKKKQKKMKTEVRTVTEK